MQQKTFLFTLTFVIVGLALLYIAILLKWFGIANGTGANFCEASSGKLIVQPSNTFSNLGFLFVALISAYHISTRSHKYSSPFIILPATSLVFCISVALIGICSSAMHATETPLGGLLDMNSMYLFAGFMFSYASLRLFKLNTITFIFIYLTALFICNYVAINYHTTFGANFYPGSAVFGFFCVLGIVFEFLNFKTKKIEIKFKYATLCSIIFLTAFGLWHFGTTGHYLCLPNSWLQWHALWHIMCALSTYCLFKYYISEIRSN